MKTSLQALAVVLIFGGSFLFLFAGSHVIRRLPAIRRLKKAKTLLGSATLKKPPTNAEKLYRICDRRLGDYYEGHLPPKLKEYESLELGDVVGIVHYRERELVRALTELRKYAGAVLFFGGLAFAFAFDDPKFTFSISGVWQWFGTHPLQVLDLLSVITIVVFALRLKATVDAISEMLEPGFLSEKSDGPKRRVGA